MAGKPAEVTALSIIPHKAVRYGAFFFKSLKLRRRRPKREHIALRLARNQKEEWIAQGTQIFALFILTVAAAESAIGLAILILYSRVRGTIAIESIRMLNG